MLIRLVSALALLALPTPAFAQCIGYGGKGTTEQQFDQCLAGEWGEEGCTSGRSIAHDGLTNEAGEACTIDYLIRDPHTGGFRLTTVCGEVRTTEVWIVEGGQLKSGNEITGFPTVAWQCEAHD